MVESNYQLAVEESKQIDPKNCINLNIGVLGHVDSGKTSLAKALTRITSTAALDKNPQSKERGITLDLGFSAFFTHIPDIEKFKEIRKNYQYFQFTLVDCPGHASLIKTIIGGASIIDIMFLVIDINKGVQTQTAECMVIGELLMQKMIVILNKIDMIGIEKREEFITKRSQALRKVFQKTVFGANLPMVPISANSGDNQTINIELLLKNLIDNLEIPVRNSQGPFFYLIDHCFPIKGQGSVVTGTVTQGQVSVGDEIQFPQIGQNKKIKSIQMFKKQVNKAQQGDRVGILFTQLDHTLITKISYFKGQINSKAKFHITSGHQTVMATLKMFYTTIQDETELAQINQYCNFREMNNIMKSNKNTKEMYKFNYNRDYEYLEIYEKPKDPKQIVFALLHFETPLISSINSMIIGSKFDQDITQNNCRLGFNGHILEILDESDLMQAKKLKIVRKKHRVGIIEKIVDNYTILINDLFKKETNIANFIGQEVIMSITGNVGKIQMAFGKKGKVKATFDKGVYFDLKQEQNKFEEQKADIQDKFINSEIKLFYKKYLFYKN